MSNEMTLPTLKTVWKHKNGDTYQIIMFSNLDSTRHDKYPPTVTYQRLKDETIWSRPLSRWYDSFTSLF